VSAPVRDSAGRIVTDRLRLRQWVEADLEPFAAMGKDPRVMAYFPTLLTRAESDAQAMRQHQSIATTGIGFWAVETLATGRFIGFTGIKPVTMPGPIEGETEIGWRLACEHWGMGYAREAAAAALHIGFVERGLASVVAMTVVGNTASWGLMERLGMVRRPDLDFDHPDLPDGHRLRPHIVYSIAAP